METQNLEKKRFFNLLILIFSMVFIVSCGGPNPSNPSGTYSSHVPQGSYVMNGYHRVVLESDGTFYVTLEGNGYTIYGNWSIIDNGVSLSLSKNDPEFNSYNGKWEWIEHNNGKGVEKKGMVLKKQNSEVFRHLYPL